MGASAFANLWKRSRAGTSDDDEPGCFQMRQPGKYFTTEEYKIETTVSQHIFVLFRSITFYTLGSFKSHSSKVIDEMSNLKLSIIIFVSRLYTKIFLVIIILQFLFQLKLKLNWKFFFYSRFTLTK